MKQLRLPIFNSQIKYYNLRIVPPSPVFEKILALKKEFESTYGKQPLSGSKPHINLASFKMNSKYQDHLIKAFDELAQKKRFILNIKDFDVFESSRALFVNVVKSETIKAIHEEVNYLHGKYLKGKLRSFHISDTPHLTISKTRGKKMLYESLQHFQKTNYSEQIEVDQLLLVSRSKYKTWDWEHKIPLS